MKKVFLFFLVLVGMMSCNVIKPEDRLMEMQGVDVTERNVLLVDFTGWQCVNCPEAAKVANGLVSRYGQHVIVVSMHPEGSSFTDPGSSGPDFATNEAMEYMKAYGGSVQTPLPAGIIDGQEYDGSCFVDYQQWAAVVTDRLSADVEYTMMMAASTTSCHVELIQKGFGEPRNINVMVWLLEDSIIAPQLTKSGAEAEYAHCHVFRKCLNGNDIWGESVDMESGEGSIDVSYQLPPLEGKNFVIVAVAVDAETHEVIQAEEVMLRRVESGVNPDNFYVTLEDGTRLDDGDTVDIYEVERDFLTQMAFTGYYISNYPGEHDFTINEKRYFDYETYSVTMCVFGNCRSDNPEQPGCWGPYSFAGLSENDFQSHVTIPDELLGEEVLLETDYEFSDGDKTKTIRVRFHYAPEQSPE